MREDDFDLGDLVWIDFEFENDEKGTLHPAIVLEDQDEIIAVLSGTSYPTPEHLLVRNEMFTSFEVSPYCIEHENARTIKHETYFQLEIVKGVKSDKIKSRIGRLNPDRLEELLARCAMRSWFSSDRTEQNDASQWDLICWVRNEHDSSIHIGLEDLNLGVIVGKLKNGFTKSVLREAFKNYFPKTMYTQQFKQGLTIQNVDYDENTINLISEIINENDFKENNVYNFKNINDDFVNNKNLDKIWLLCKYFLMIKGFKNRYDSINIDLKATEKSNLLNS